MGIKSGKGISVFQVLNRFYAVLFYSRLIRLLSAGSFLLGSFLAVAQPGILHTSILSEKDGLLGHYNHDIIQHSDGVLWIASSLGLTRYDGHRFKTFNRLRSGLSDVNIVELEEYKDGRLALKYSSQNFFIDLFDPAYFVVTRLDLNGENGIAGGWFYRFQLERRVALQQARHLQELDEFKSRLYASVTHEFRTPLTVILGLSRQLLNTDQ